MKSRISISLNGTTDKREQLYMKICQSYLSLIYTKYSDQKKLFEDVVPYKLVLSGSVLSSA